MKITINNKYILSTFFALFVLVCAYLVICKPTQVKADKYEEQIRALEEQNSVYQQRLTQLSNESATLARAVAEYQAKVGILQNQINISQNKFDKLNAQIEETTKKIKESSDSLGQTLADLYIDDQFSTVEILASSSNISDYLDKQEYRSSIRDNLVQTIQQIKNLKTQLEKDKKDVELVLKDLNVQKSELVAKQTEQQNMLNATRSQESQYQSYLQNNKAEIQKIRDEQVAFYASLTSANSIVLKAGDPSKGGYPSKWANSCLDCLVDSWGMYNRECVSYTAWKVHQNYGYMPYWGGIGNAWQWAFSGWASTDWSNYGAQVSSSYPNKKWHTSNAESWGIPWGTRPKVGSVAVYNGKWGHVAWVESVSGDKVTVSQYNYGVSGAYSEMTVNSSFFERYIYFGEWR